MTKSLDCLILLVVLLSGLGSDIDDEFYFVFSGTEPIYTYVCQGDFVQLFQNITLTSVSTVNLYINGLRKTLISTWHSGQNLFTLEGYKTKVSLDNYRTIWMRNVQLSENGTYLLQYDTDNLKSEVHLNVMVAPSISCKPKIEKNQNLLIASLEKEHCGSPLAQVHWMEYPNISYIHKDMVRLPPENGAGTYYACAESPALRCAKTLSLSNYCSGFTVQREVPVQGNEDASKKDKEVSGQGNENESGKDKEVPSQANEVESGKDKDNSPRASSEIYDMKIVIIVLVTFMAVVVLFVGIIIVIRKRKKRSNVELGENTNARYSKESKLKDESEQFLKPETEDGVLKSNELICQEMAPDPASTPELPASEQGIEESTTEHHSSNKTEVTIESVMPPSPRCNICHTNKIALFVLSDKDRYYIKKCVSCNNSSM